MRVTKTELPGVLIIEPSVFDDERGFFKETYQARNYKDIGIVLDFVQDNHSRSIKGVLRGIHYQLSKPQGKLVSCIRGKVFDVAVDINPASRTFGQHVGVQLTGDNHKQLWVPPGYAHGFCVLSEEADLIYKCTDFYDPSDEGGVIWNDPTLAIDWPINNPILSIKDAALPQLTKVNLN